MITKLNKNNWQEFRIDDIFIISRGKRLIDIDRISGDVEYYSASEYNNGLTDKISNPLFIEKNALIYTTFGKCFYVGGEFTASDEINILKHKKLNIYNGLFLATLITQNKYKYGFGRKAFKNKFSKDFIKLPVQKDGSIDWSFMENYIKKLSEKIKYDSKVIESRIIKKTIKLIPKSWKEFKIKDIFNIQKGERLTVADRTLGDTPLLTASSVNNGVSGFIDYEIFKDKKRIFENKITVDMFCNVFYQEFRYFSDDNIHTLLFKDKSYEKYYENKFINLFLVSILKQLSRKYDYGRQVRLKRFEEEIINLPVTNKKELDFEFMENYIKSLNYSQGL